MAGTERQQGPGSRSEGVGETAPDSAVRWTDPDLAAANAAGRVTPAQRAMITGDSRLPYVWWPLLTVAGGMLAVVGFVTSVLLLGDESATHRVEAAGVPSLFAQLFMFVCAFLIPGLASLYGMVTVGQGLSRGEDRRQHRRRLRVRTAALTPPRIACAIGRIQEEDNRIEEEAKGCGGSRREARVGPHQVPVPVGAPELPPPGPYRLYWLESVRCGEGPLLLSAQPVDTADAKHRQRTDAEPTARTGERLAEALGFTPQDLETNRSGRLSSGQRRPERVVRRRVGVLVGFLYLLVVALLGWTGSLVRVGEQAWLCWFLGCLSWGLLGAWLLRRLRAVWRTEPQVECTVGEVTVGPPQPHTWSKWVVSIGSYQLWVDPTVAQAFLPAPGRYALYHRRGTLLSAEPADSRTSATDGCLPAVRSPAPAPQPPTTTEAAPADDWPSDRHVTDGDAP
ncbi:hypothetical protein ACFYRG_51975 [Streptomyces mirabilis]|uniref:hypothetical protein n=1 Tax=Streptomyces mirabilis TaxID=68239 RepID=UPI0036AD036D